MAKLGDMPEASLDDIPFERALHYACRDADGTGRLKPQLWARIQAMGLEDTYRLELDTYHLIDRMMMVGIKPDLAHFAELSWRLQGHIEDLQYQLERATSRESFNANSSDQVGAYLFESLGLPSYKRTPGGEDSTNDKVLEGLEREFGARYPVLLTIREYREVYKLKNTFVDRVPDFVYRWPCDGRIHATFRTTRIPTGRLAASDPSLLAQPEHGKFAKDFKRGWVAEDGHVIASWDASQIELRGLAHMSRDPVLVGAYTYTCAHPKPCRHDTCLLKSDLHAALAHRIFGVLPTKQDKDKHRYPVKEVNFGLPNGMQAQGLQAALRAKGVFLSEDDAQKWIDDADKLYVGVPRFKAACIAEARRFGYIRCESGRIRYIGGIRSFDRITREAAEREAFSTKIQEYAQRIMKRAEYHVWNDILRPLRRDYWIEPLVQVHDALKLEMECGLEQDVNAMMRWAMTTAVGHLISVPLGVEGEYGPNFADTTPFEEM